MIGKTFNSFKQSLAARAHSVQSAKAYDITEPNKLSGEGLPLAP